MRIWVSCENFLDFIAKLHDTGVLEANALLEEVTDRQSVAIHQYWFSLTAPTTVLEIMPFVSIDNLYYTRSVSLMLVEWNELRNRLYVNPSTLLVWIEI
jgi:hypothetical protein